MAQSLRAGHSFSHYRVVSAIGAGGMGEVYKAVDDALDRSVALKILPPELVKNDERLRRFVQEAKSASSLSHPHIVTIYEIGKAELPADAEEKRSDSQEVHFIAMELVDGRTLKQEIHEEHTRLPTLLRYLGQVADGLAKAHTAGIIHRDLKPENIMITRDGYAKVLDFGLAKLTERKALSEESSAPTAVRVNTREGEVMGTVGYMSPEQVQGKVVDHRSDIFSFGCILYEAATAQKPFDADSDVDIMHKILHDKPRPVDELNPRVPGELRRMIRRCLAKEPDKRYQSMRDIAIELNDVVDEWDELVASPSTVSSSSSSSSPAIAALQKRTAPWVAIGALLLLVIGAIGFGLWRNRRSGTEPQSNFSSMKMSRITDSGRVQTAAISPDGRYVAHSIDEGGNISLWVRQVATGSDVQVVLPGETPFAGITFSPDGDYIYFVRSETKGPSFSNLYVVPTLGGTPRKLLFDIDTPVSFSPDGKQFTFVRGYPDLGHSAVMVANADGSGAKKLAVAKDPEFYPNIGAAWSPNGRRIATVRRAVTGGTRERVVVIDTASGQEQPLSHQPFFFIRGMVWLPDGSAVVFTGIESETANSRQLWRLSFPDGVASRISNDLGNYRGVSVTADGKAIATAQMTRTSNLWLSAPNGEGARQVTTGSGMRVEDLVASKQSLYFTAARDNGTSVWTGNLDGTGLKQLVTDNETNWAPHAPVDGSFVAYHSFREKAPHVWRVDRDGSNPRRITPEPTTGQPARVSPDGRWLFYRADKAPLLMRVAVDGGPAVVLAERFGGNIIVSPDGKWICGRFWGTRSGGRTDRFVGVLPSEGGAMAKRFDDNGSIYRWSPDGKSLTHLTERGGVSNIWRQPLDGRPPEQITHFTSGKIFAFDWTPDGSGLLLAKGDESSDVVLISNFR